MCYWHFNMLIYHFNFKNILTANSHNTTLHLSISHVYEKQKITGALLAPSSKEGAGDGSQYEATEISRHAKHQ